MKLPITNFLIQILKTHGFTKIWSLLLKIFGYQSLKRVLLFGRLSSFVDNLVFRFLVFLFSWLVSFGGSFWLSEKALIRLRNLMSILLVYRSLLYQKLFLEISKKERESLKILFNPPRPCKVDEAKMRIAMNNSDLLSDPKIRKLVERLAIIDMKSISCSASLIVDTSSYRIFQQIDFDESIYDFDSLQGLKHVCI